jgi:hypothetical protein
VARVEKIITYTKPKPLQGALVQLALACDTLSDIDSVLQAEKDKILGRRLLQMDQILRSAIRQCGLRSAMRQTLPPTHGGNLYRRCRLSPMDRSRQWMVREGARTSRAGGTLKSDSGTPPPLSKLVAGGFIARTPRDNWPALSFRAGFFLEHLRPAVRHRFLLAVYCTADLDCDHC